MDDVIYILIAIAWVAFSIYNANQKKKQKLAREAQASVPRTPEAAPKPRSILEEILMGEEMPEFQAEDAHEEIKPELVPEYKAALEYQQEIQTRALRAEQQLQVSNNFSFTSDSSPLPFPDEANIGLLKIFDLRQAVIYSIILERPYR